MQFLVLSYRILFYRSFEMFSPHDFELREANCRRFDKMLMYQTCGIQFDEAKRWARLTVCDGKVCEASQSDDVNSIILSTLLEVNWKLT